MKDCSEAANTYTHNKIKQKYKHVRKGAQHSANETKIDTTPLHAKTSNIFPVHTFRRINEAFFDKKRVQDFPFGPIEISGRK
jgi:hypothetical protein